MSSNVLEKVWLLVHTININEEDSDVSYSVWTTKQSAEIERKHLCKEYDQRILERQIFYYSFDIYEMEVYD